MHIRHHRPAGRTIKKGLTRISERTLFKTFIFKPWDPVEVPWVEWMGAAIREMAMKPEDFWGLPFFTAVRLICPVQESDEITRKELLAHERKLMESFNG